MKEMLKEKLVEYRDSLEKNRQHVRSIEEDRRKALQNIERLQGAIGAMTELLNELDEEERSQPMLYTDD